VRARGEKVQTERRLPRTGATTDQIRASGGQPAVQDFIEPGNAGGDPFRRILLKARSVSSDLLGRFGRLRLRVTMRTVCFAVHCVASCSVSPPSSTDTPNLDRAAPRAAWRDA